MFYGCCGFVIILKQWPNGKYYWCGWSFPNHPFEPCSKCLTSWHQIRKCLRDCLRFAYACTGFAYAHILSYVELSLAYAHHSFAYATPLQLQGAPYLTWTQGFRTWLRCGHQSNAISAPSLSNGWLRWIASAAGSLQVSWIDVKADRTGKRIQKGTKNIKSYANRFKKCMIVVVILYMHLCHNHT